jgi:hypothetical protein
MNYVIDYFERFFHEKTSELRSCYNSSITDAPDLLLPEIECVAG